MADVRLTDCNLSKDLLLHTIWGYFDEERMVQFNCTLVEGLFDGVEGESLVPLGVLNHEIVGNYSAVGKKFYNRFVNSC